MVDFIGVGFLNFLLKKNIFMEFKNFNFIFFYFVWSILVIGMISIVSSVRYWYVLVVLFLVYIEVMMCKIFLMCLI